LDSFNSNLFKSVNTRPRWEGIVFTDLDFSDHRISISAADVAPHLQEYIECIWFMRWDFAEQEGVRCIRIPNPCAKLVALQQNNKTFRPLIIGASTEASLFELRGAGATVGFDFKPGGLYPFLGRSMQNWPDAGILAAQLLNGLPSPSQAAWTELALSKWIVGIQDVLSDLLTSPIKNNYKQIAPLVNEALRGVFSSPEDMTQLSETSLRSLQRIFQEEVGVSPRDLLRIARFNEAIRIISENDFKSFVDTALDSGFFDQPHMTNEFQKLVATSPSKFRRYL
jgi:AraC-like DNA-binding protein